MKSCRRAGKFEIRDRSGAMRPICRVEWLGTRDYREVWELQKTRAAQRLAGEIPDTLLLLEHPPTITLGRAADRANLLASPDTLRRHRVEAIEIDRGGDIMYHGPGQLVGYPIWNLQQPPHTPDLHRYLRLLEEVLIRTLAAFDLPSGRFLRHTGVWTRLDTSRPVKIAAIGVKAGRWITQHGFALNVQPDLSHFGWIVPCGIRDYGVTSLAQELGRAITVAEVLPLLLAAFADVFEMEMQDDAGVRD